MDQINQKILELIRENARMSYSMEGPEEVYVTTGEVAPPVDTGEEGQEGSTSQGGSNGDDVPEEVELTGDVAYIEEDVEP